LSFSQISFILAEGTWPPINPNWFKQQEIMAKIGPFINLGGAQAAQGGIISFFLYFF
jgi:hypothetical protein